MLSLEHHGAAHKPLLSWISQFENLPQPGQELWASTVSEVAASTSGCSSVLNAHQAAAHSSQLQGVHNKGMQKHRRVRFTIKSMHIPIDEVTCMYHCDPQQGLERTHFLLVTQLSCLYSMLDALSRHTTQCQMHSQDTLINVNSLPAATKSSCKWHNLLT